MDIKLGRILFLSVVLTFCCGLGFAETFLLDDDLGWQNVADSEEGAYLLELSRIKQQLSSGSESDVVAALEQLKTSYPSLAGEEVDAFIEAEKLYAKGDWSSSAKQYRLFTDEWPVSDLRPAALERMYSIATAFLQGQKRKFLKVLPISAFDTGVDLMHDVADRAGSSPLGLRALTTLAQTQENKNELEEAYNTWEEIAWLWPTGKIKQNALLRMAQTKHASYEGTQYDARVLERAEDHFEDYLNQYPDDAARLEIPKTLQMIKEQLAFKEYDTGFYYERTGNPEAANSYYNNVISKWPNSKAAQMARSRMTPDAAPAIKKTVRRSVTDGFSGFLDSWFWLEPVLKPMTNLDTKENTRGDASENNL
jgi:tetratricopeptide (TPR) repeat protein